MRRVRPRRPLRASALKEKVEAEELTEKDQNKPDKSSVTDIEE